ncbi:copper resistance protein CopC [Nocardia panacis]|uniref:Copper resistance protein CopC n=1 Tax=Nocardia panacis TaxID=2340916 RepID=A0A3A4KK70_9NOCA|nr:copper resistance CopC family protein [Nocardia panacis]RJO77054.1 copper resistance protein CopC [Nocardia panacis]
MRRALTGLVALGSLLFGIGLLGAGNAAAHSTPTGSVPADGATVDSGPARVSVSFNEALQTSFPSLTVVGPDDNLWSKGAPAVDGNTVSIEVGELGPAGKYTIAYRVTSADGHPVSGTRTFTLSKPGAGTPGPKAKGSGNSDGGDSGGVPVWVFIVGAAVLFGGGLVFALWGGRRKPRQG